jgi:hypothetical protein
LKELRKKLQEKTGQKTYHWWSVEEIQAKLAE